MYVCIYKKLLYNLFMCMFSSLTIGEPVHVLCFNWVWPQLAKRSSLDLLWAFQFQLNSCNTFLATHRCLSPRRGQVPLGWQSWLAATGGVHPTNWEMCIMAYIHPLWVIQRKLPLFYHSSLLSIFIVLHIPPVETTDVFYYLYSFVLSTVLQSWNHEYVAFLGCPFYT